MFTGNELQKPFRNDARLVAPTKVRALRPFCVGGERIEPGQETQVDLDTAKSLRSLGKCELMPDDPTK